jgi:Ca-activated chloride channel family protein
VPRLAVSLTNDLRVLGGGLAGLTAEGETALYDSVMFGLYYFASVRGQRALLLLSDGKDEASRFDFDETLDYARRAGVTLYAIGLFQQANSVRSKLQELADETGGRAFFIDDLGKLSEVYSLIQEELRSQYVLTYQSSNQTDVETFRAISVKLSRRDLVPKTLSGYYP